MKPKSRSFVPKKAAKSSPPPTMAKAATSKTPQVDSFKISGKRKGTYKEMASALRSVSFLEVAPEKDALNVAYVESRDIDKNPYLFSIAKIEEDGISVIYSIPPNISPTKRRMDVIRYLLNILTLIEKYYLVDNKVLFQLIEKSSTELLESVSVDYSKLYTSFDSLKKQVSDLKKKVDTLTEQSTELTSQNYELKAFNDELLVRLKQLEGLSDDALKAKLQEWVLEHNGEINVIEFAKIHKVSESRVEEILNELVNEGYLEVLR